MPCGPATSPTSLRRRAGCGDRPVEPPSGGLEHAAPHADQPGKRCATHGVVSKTSRYRVIFHSDSGSQYCSHEFEVILKQYGMQSSMSRCGNCWDNEPSESLWGSLKAGRLHGMRFETRRQAMDEVIDWLMFYNHRRLHSTLGYVSPMKFEKNGFADQLKYAALRDTEYGIRNTEYRGR